METGRRSPTLKAEPAGFPDGFNTKRESKTGIEDEAKEEDRGSFQTGKINSGFLSSL